jgi:predicted acyl esterase
VTRLLPDAKLVLAPAFTEISLASITFGLPTGGGGSLCTAAPAGTPALSAVAMETATTDMVVAGNPYVDLFLSSSRRVGLIDFALYAVEPGFKCPQVASEKVRWLAGGGIDLTHYNSKYEARPFPVNTPTKVRIDLSDVTARIPAGYRLALVLTDGDLLHIGERDAYPTIVSIHGAASRLVLPVVDQQPNA